jgi:hypothetical protein
MRANPFANAILSRNQQKKRDANHCCVGLYVRAGEGTRTLDIQLGKRPSRTVFSAFFLGFYRILAAKTTVASHCTALRENAGKNGIYGLGTERKTVHTVLAKRDQVAFRSRHSNQQTSTKRVDDFLGNSACQ